MAPKICRDVGGNHPTFRLTAGNRKTPIKPWAQVPQAATADSIQHLRHLLWQRFFPTNILNPKVAEYSKFSDNSQPALTVHMNKYVILTDKYGRGYVDDTMNVKDPKKEMIWLICATLELLPLLGLYLRYWVHVQGFAFSIVHFLEKEEESTWVQPPLSPLRSEAHFWQTGLRLPRPHTEALQCTPEAAHQLPWWLPARALLTSPIGTNRRADCNPAAVPGGGGGERKEEKQEWWRTVNIL